MTLPERSDRGITGRKQAEASEKLLATFPSDSPDPVMRTDQHGTLVFANEASRPLLEAWSCGVGRPLPDRLVETIAAAFASGQRTEIEVHYARRTVAIRLAPIVESGHVNLHGRDITERKQAHHFLEIANRHLEMAPLLDEFVAEFKTVTGCAAVGIRILDQRGGIPFQAYDGFSLDFFQSESPLSIWKDQCRCIDVIRGKTDARLPFYTEGGSFLMNTATSCLAALPPGEKWQTRNVCTEAGYESVALVPIRMGSRIIGLIHVADPRKNAIPRETVEMLERAAMQLGTAIQRVRAEEALRAARDELETRVRQRTAELAKANQALQAEIAERKRLENQVLDITTQEQQRIGQELHDGVGQELTGLGYLAKSLEKKLQARGLPEAKTAEELAQGIPHALSHVRRIVQGLVPLEVGARDLIPALRALASSIEERSDVACHVQCRRPPRLDDRTAIHLYRIIQEAVNNAVKHGHPRKIRIRLKGTNRQITLEVRDDGVGIGSSCREASGSGLRIMRYRAGVIGGTLDIRPQRGGGTLVTCSLPREQHDDRHQ